MELLSALLINESDDNHEIVDKNGYKYFSTPEEFKKCVELNYITNIYRLTKL